jgi:Hint domain
MMSLHFRSEPRGPVMFASSSKKQTRRNVIRAGAILASAVAANVAAIKTSVAGQGGNGQGGNGQGGNGQGSHCLLRGTTIQTASGNRKIEELMVGDLLPTLFGGQRPIQWIARYPFRKSDPFKPWVVKAVQPVRVARSALAPDVPHTDLYLTGWHALFVDGVLIPVGSLINGTTIKLYEARELAELEFFNIKLESHDVIYADGAPVETLLQVDECAVNFSEYLRKYGAPRTNEVRCAPIAPYGGRGELRSRVRCAISPWLDRRGPIDVIRDRLEERAVEAII